MSCRINDECEREKRVVVEVFKSQVRQRLVSRAAIQMTRHPTPDTQMIEHSEVASNRGQARVYRHASRCSLAPMLLFCKQLR